MNTVRLTVSDMPGKNRAEKQAYLDEHGSLWFVVDVQFGSWVLESAASGERRRMTGSQSPMRESEQRSALLPHRESTR